MARRGAYEGAAYSPDVKAALGAIGHKLREEGWTVPAVHELYEKAGYTVGEETLRRWSNAAAADQPIISPNKRTGVKKKVDDEQRQGGFWSKKKSRPSALQGVSRGLFWSCHKPRDCI
jgi:hypothetical protein